MFFFLLNVQTENTTTFKNVTLSINIKMNCNFYYLYIDFVFKQV